MESEYKDLNFLPCGEAFVEEMEEFCGKVFTFEGFTIGEDDVRGTYFPGDAMNWRFTISMIEPVEEETSLKVGDCVLINRWEDMEEEHGLDLDGDIFIANDFFTRKMRRFCETPAYISSIDGDIIFLYSNYFPDIGEYSFNKHMFSPAL